MLRDRSLQRVRHEVPDGGCSEVSNLQRALWLVNRRATAGPKTRHTLLPPILKARSASSLKHSNCWPPNALRFSSEPLLRPPPIQVKAIWRRPKR